MFCACTLTESEKSPCTLEMMINLSQSVKVKVLPAPMAHSAAPISVSVVLSHTSTNAVKATAGGWSTGSSACLTFPLHSLMSSARREGSEYHFKSLWHELARARTQDLLFYGKADTLPLGHHTFFELVNSRS